MGGQYKDFLKEIGDSVYGPVTDSCGTVFSGSVEG
jgi:hypothetical protein